MDGIDSMQPLATIILQLVCAAGENADDWLACNSTGASKLQMEIREGFMTHYRYDEIKNKLLNSLQ